MNYLGSGKNLKAQRSIDSQPITLSSRLSSECCLELGLLLPVDLPTVAMATCQIVDIPCAPLALAGKTSGEKPRHVILCRRLPLASC